MWRGLVQTSVVWYDVGQPDLQMSYVSYFYSPLKSLWPSLHISTKYYVWASVLAGMVAKVLRLVSEGLWFMILWAQKTSEATDAGLEVTKSCQRSEVTSLVRPGWWNALKEVQNSPEEPHWCDLGCGEVCFLVERNRCGTMDGGGTARVGPAWPMGADGWGRHIQR